MYLRKQRTCIQKIKRRWWKKSKITQMEEYGILLRITTKNLIIYMETQKIPNSQNNCKKEKWSWKNQAPWLYTILHGCSSQDSRVLVQTQKWRSMTQDRKPRGKPRYLWSPNLWQRKQEYTMEKRQPLFKKLVIL